MAILEEIEDEPPAPAPAPAPPPAPGSGVGGVGGGGGGGGGGSDSDSDDEPPPLESAAQLDALNARRKVADRVAAARSGDAGVGGGGGGGSRSGGTSTGGSTAPIASGGGGSGGVKKGFFDAPAASKNKASSGVKKGFFDAPRAKPKPKPGGKAGEEEDIVFLRGKKTTTAGGKDIPDFMRVEVEGSEAAEKMKKELMDKLKPDKDTVDEVMKNQSLMSGFDDPEVMKAVDEIAKNPQAMRKYQNNPKVLAFYQQMAGMVGQRLEKMGDNSTSGV